MTKIQCVAVISSNVPRGRVKTFSRTTGKHSVHPDQGTCFVHTKFTKLSMCYVEFSIHVCKKLLFKRSREHFFMLAKQSQPDFLSLCSVFRRTILCTLLCMMLQWVIYLAWYSNLYWSTMHVTRMN